MKNSEDNLPIDGILLVNKPQGLSSNAVLQKVKRIYKAKKAGHTGSLDPLATGMLPICFGEATKICQFLLDADKKYSATGLLGIKTSTADALGEVIATKEDVSVSEAELRSVLQQFIGHIKQVPSMFSALKHQGRPLYQLAREGKTIERKARDIQIHDITLNAFDGKYFDITVSCTKGTYIRNLVEDIGERLSVYAHVTKLHRIVTAGFEQEPMVGLEELAAMQETQRQAILLPMERGILHIPVLRIESEQVKDLQQGKTINLEDMTTQGLVRLHEREGEFIGLGEVDSEGLLKVKRLLAVIPKK